ncbi:MAG: hypothetical protein P4L92_15255 [Rudaea sp.]|nr:hypothetical protein [Rudaea sp.]
MKSFKMKALAVAVLGLAGLGMAGSAFATCPTIPAATNTPGGGGAWTSQTVTSATFGSVTPGLDNTSCALSIAINAGAASNTKGFVTDGSPQNEPRYRARFYINLAGLTGLTVANRQSRLFSALATTPPTGAGAEEVIINLVGGTTPSLRFIVGDTGSPGNQKIVNAVFPTATVAGNYRVEFDLNSTAGTFRYWVLDAAADNSTFNDTNPTGSVTMTDTGWSGVKQINLGLFGTSTNFRADVAGQALIVDEFDSRRQTFIGQ